MENLVNVESKTKSNELMNFTHEGLGSVRCIEVDGEPWFVGKDVAESLGYSNASKAVSVHVDSEDKQMIMLDIADSQNGNVLAGKAKTAFINESGLYALIFSSKLPSAKKFKRWVTSEVLPQIRRTGSYTSLTQQLAKQELVLQALEIQQEMITDLQNKIEADSEKVEFAESVFSSPTTVDMNTMAKLLNDDGLKIGRNRLFEILRNEGILMKDNTPYQKYLESGHFEVAEHMICNVIVPQTYVTGKGQELVHKIVTECYE